MRNAVSARALRPLRSLAATAALLLAACSSAPPPSAPQEIHVTPEATSPAPTSTPQNPASPDEPAGAAGGPEGPLQQASQALGSPCTADAPACGTAGRIAFFREVQRDAPMARALPCKAVGTSRQSIGNATRACVDGNRVVVASVCIACRIAAEERTIAVIGEMTPEQRRTVQRIASLPESPLLTTIAAWREAIDAAAKRAQEEP